MAEKDDKALSQVAKWASHNERVHAAEEDTERALSDVTQKVDMIHDLLDQVTAHHDGDKPIDAERRAKQVVKVGDTLDKVIERVEHIVAA